MTQIITTGQTKDGKEVSVVDLVDLFRENDPRFEELFEQTHEIYEYSFPPEEKEDEETLREYIAQENLDLDEGIYSNVIALMDNKGVGLLYSDIAAYENKGIINFTGYVATHKDHRHKGIGTILAKSLEKRMANFGKQTSISPLVSFLEVDQPNYDISDKMRNIIRPAYHHKASGVGAAVIINDNNSAEIVPYAQPGIGHGEAEVPMLAAIVPMVNGSFEKIAAEPGSVISKNGKLKIDKENFYSINSSDTFDILDSVLNFYAEEEEVYDPKQVKAISERIEKSLEKTKQVHLIPILDTKHLRYANK